MGSLICDGFASACGTLPDISQTGATHVVEGQ